MPTEKLPVHAVILAGGRGTRFWPRSRTRTPKQLLNIVGKGTMLEQTVARLRPLVPAAGIWTVTNAEQESAVRKQLVKASRVRVLVEPVGRNTAAAIALAAFHIQHFTKGDALMAVLPADHYIAQTSKYQKIVAAALHAAREAGRMVVLESRRRGPKRVSVISRACGRRSAQTKFRFMQYADSRKSPRSKPLKNTWHPEIISGTRACFSGGCQRYSTS